MPCLVYIATSIDGYIARTDGTIDWLMDFPNPDNGDFGFRAFMKRVDAIVMGRKTFETAASFTPWPYTKPVFVLSTSKFALPADFSDKAELLHGPPGDVVRALQNRGFTSLYVDGGATIRGFLEADLIDEFIITRIPVILGTGTPLFAPINREFRFAHVSTEVYCNAIVKTTYRRVR